MILITQTYQDHSCSVSVSDKNNEFFYAYYIYSNNKCVDRIMYSSNKELNFNTSDMNGVITVEVFLKNKKTRVIENQFLKPIRLERNKIQLVDITSLDHNIDCDIVVDGVEIPVLLNKKENVNKLFIFLNGSVGSKTQEKYYPYFSRVSWSDKFNGHCLYLYDQSLNMSDDYALGWYRGTGTINLHEKYIVLIKKITELMKIKNKDIYFYGSSGGGFAALKFAESFPKSTAISINPQVDCLKYGDKKAVEKFKSVFTNYSDQSAVEIDHTKFYKHGAKMILVQNTQDIDHYENHFKPFWTKISHKLNGYDSRYHNYSLVYDHESGHGGEPPEVLEKIISLINK